MIESGIKWAQGKAKRGCDFSAGPGGEGRGPGRTPHAARAAAGEQVVGGQLRLEFAAARDAHEVRDGLRGAECPAAAAVRLVADVADARARGPLGARVERLRQRVHVDVGVLQHRQPRPALPHAHQALQLLLRPALEMWRHLRSTRYTYQQVCVCVERESVCV